MELNRGPWADRADAGRELGKAVRAALPDSTGPPVVLGLPRGGVVVAAEVATVVGGELDVLVVRKAGVPWHPELALGAVTASGTRVENTDIIHRAGLADDDAETAFADAERDARERERRFREGRPRVPVGRRTVVIVDDGLATGATALAAAMLIRRTAPAPARVILAAPVAPPDTVLRLSEHVDDVVILQQPSSFLAVGTWFRDFTQVSDDQVREILARSA